MGSHRRIEGAEVWVSEDGRTYEVWVKRGEEKHLHSTVVHPPKKEPKVEKTK